MTDRNQIDCPRAKTWMTPCIARDGATALSDSPQFVCVGCGANPREELRKLGDRYQPAKLYRQIKDPIAAADKLTELVGEYVEQP